MKRLIALFLLLPLFCLSQDYYLLVGTYTTTTSEGIYVYKFNAQTGEPEFVSKTKTSNPSFLALSPNGKYVFAVNENDPGTVTAFSFSKDSGTLRPLNTAVSSGAHPCYVSYNARANNIVVGNYSGGNLAVMGINLNGTVSAPRQVIQHKGKSINEKRQEKPHVHATVFSPDYDYLFVPDLGIDKVMIYKVATGSGALIPAEQNAVDVKPGSGPRHMEFHPNGKYSYLMEELSGVVSVFEYNNGKLKPVQRISAHPVSFTGSIGSADIHVSPDGKFLYCSNRGDANNLAIFNINQQTGKITIAGYQPVLGVKPRNFTISPDGNFLLVANQDSDEIVIFRIDKKTGLLDDTKKTIKVPKPVCLKWSTMK